MITATYFGEITELDSRAVWYSDEEDDDDEVEDNFSSANSSTSPKLGSIGPISHDTFRSKIQLDFKRAASNLKLEYSSCVISLSSSWQFKNLKLSNSDSLPYLGCFDTVGKAFAFPGPAKINEQNTEVRHSLWLLFDKGHDYISGHGVGYFVEALREKLYSEFGLDHACQLIILSQQFSDGVNLEYLSNFGISTKMDTAKLPFVGRPLFPPSLIKNQFESSLFEQLTISHKLTLVVCLPNPKNFWFDKTSMWPSLADKIITHRLNDNNLEKTLIFT